MVTLREWLTACRPGQALLAPFCVAVGASYAHFDAQSGPGVGVDLLMTLAAYAAAIGVNLFDNTWERLDTPAPDAEASASESAAAGVAAFALAALCGFGLVGRSGSSPLGYGAMAVTLGVLRGAPLVGFAALGSGLGELSVFLALGPLAASAGFASQAGTGSWGAVLAGAPAGLIALSALFGRRGMRETIDRTAARRIGVSLPVLAAAAVALLVRSGEYGPGANAAALPLAAAAVAAWRLGPPSDGPEPGESGGAVLACALLALGAIVVALRIPAA